MKLSALAVLSASLAFTVAVAIAAEPDVDLPAPFVQTIEKRTVIDLTLPGFFGGADKTDDAKNGGALELRLFFDGDKSESMYAIHGDRTPVVIEKKERHGKPLLRYAARNLPFITIGKLQREGDRITGEVSVRDHHWGRNVTGVLKLDLTVDGGKVSGQYTDNADKDKPRTGKAHGAVLDPNGMGKGVDPIRAGYDWPQARGVNGLGSAVPIKQPIVDALAKGKFVWKSEARWPVFYTGAGSPVVAGDKVILNIHLPAGEKKYVGRVGRHFNTQKHHGMEDHGLYSHDYRGLRESDDMVFCIDAKTGLTLWKAVLPRRAVNWQGDQKANPGNTACVADGKVFVVGYGGHLYALDLETGKLLWEGLHGGGTGEKLRQAREEIRKTGAGQPSERIIGPAKSVAVWNDGVLLVSSDYLGAVYAYDAATGKPLWSEGGLIGHRGLVHLIETPNGQKHPCLIQSAKDDGRRFNRAVVLDTRTGKHLIETEVKLPKSEDGRGISGYITWKNHVVVTAGRGWGYVGQSKSPLGVGGFTLTDKGFEKVWEHYLDKDDKIVGSASQLIVMDGRLHLGGHRDNQISNIEVATGKKHANIPSTDGQGSYMQLTAGYGYLFRVSDQPAMVRAAADAEHVTEYVAAFENGYSQSTCDIALADGRVIVRTKDGLVCLDLRRQADESQPKE